jgi:arylsulfatase A-like enzyme
MMKHHTLPLTLIACAYLLSCGGPAEQGSLGSRGKSVIVVAVDGVRADALGCYGAAAATPNFDALAAESVRFEWAFAQAADPAVSFAGLLTGLYPTTAGVRAPGDRLRDEAETLAEAVSGSGMATAAFVEGSSGGNDYGLAQGFDQFYLGPGPGEQAAAWLDDHADDNYLLVLRGWSAGWQMSAAAQGIEAPEGFFERLQEVLVSDGGDEPRAMEPADLEFARALYADRVRAVDGALGEFIDWLEEGGLADRVTLVVLGTSGLDLGQHGATGRVSLHATVTRVPLLVRFPGGGESRSVDRIVEVVDVMPTVLDLAGLATPATVQGQSLIPLLEGQGKPPYLAFSEASDRGGQRAIALAGYRLVQVGEASQLFNLIVDPFELEDIAATEQDRVDVLLRHLDDWQKMVAATSLDPELRSEEELDPETLERLRSLGYIH